MTRSSCLSTPSASNATASADDVPAFTSVDLGPVGVGAGVSSLAVLLGADAESVDSDMSTSSDGVASVADRFVEAEGAAVEETDAGGGGAGRGKGGMGEVDGDRERMVDRRS